MSCVRNDTKSTCSTRSASTTKRIATLAQGRRWVRVNRTASFRFGLDGGDRPLDCARPGVGDQPPPSRADPAEVGAQLAAPGQLGAGVGLVELECLRQVRDGSAHEAEMDPPRRLEADRLDGRDAPASDL